MVKRYKAKGKNGELPCSLRSLPLPKPPCVQNPEVLQVQLWRALKEIPLETNY